MYSASQWYWDKEAGKWLWSDRERGRAYGNADTSRATPLYQAAALPSGPAREASTSVAATTPADLHSSNARTYRAYEPRYQAPMESSGTIDQRLAGLSVRPQTNSATNIDVKVEERGGSRSLIATHNKTGVHLNVQETPVDSFTDPVLQQQGVRAHRRIVRTQCCDNRFPNFKKPYRPRGFFVMGKVFSILWVDIGGSVVTGLERSKPHKAVEPVYSRVRKYVVIKEGPDYCTALPIVSYSGRGVSGSQVLKSDHAIIYTGNSPPDPLPAELPLRGETGMRPVPIRVTTDDRGERLERMSRVNFGKVTTVQHDIEVRSIGSVNRDSISALASQFSNVWNEKLAESSARVVVSSSPSVYSGRASESEDIRSNGQAGPEFRRMVDYLIQRGCSRDQALHLLQMHRARQQSQRASSSNRIPDLPIAPDLSNRGAIGIGEMSRIVQGLHAHAQSRALPVPPTLNRQQVQAYAQDGRMREDYLSRVREFWRRGQTVTEELEDSDESDDEDESDSEPDSEV